MIRIGSRHWLALVSLHDQGGCHSLVVAMAVASRGHFLQQHKISHGCTSCSVRQRRRGAGTGVGRWTLFGERHSHTRWAGQSMNGRKGSGGAGALV